MNALCSCYRHGASLREFRPGNEMTSYHVSISIGCRVSYSIANSSFRWSRDFFCTGEDNETGGNG